LWFGFGVWGWFGFWVLDWRVEVWGVQGLRGSGFGVWGLGGSGLRGQVARGYLQKTEGCELWVQG
jgi:hypothetical protein